MTRKYGFIFPGQGESHAVGMGKDFYETYPVAREFLDLASEQLKVDFKKLIFEGPLELLSETQNCQIAIYIVSMMVFKVLKEEFPHIMPIATAGLSLGEYTAATASNVLTYQQGLKLVSQRGKLMQQACLNSPGTMAVILGLSPEAVEEIVCEINKPNDLWIANLNCPGQIVVTGTKLGIETIQEVAKAKGAKRVLPLNVQGAFHSPLMQSAATELKELLDQMEIKNNDIPFMMNASGSQGRNLEEIRKNLIAQITKPVRWQSCIEEMVNFGVDQFIEIGCGKVLTGLNKRIGVSGQTYSINTLKDLELLNDKVEILN